MSNSTIPTSSMELGRKELEKSPIYDKIPEVRKEYFIKESLRIGKEEAAKFQAEEKDIFQLFDEHKIELEKRKSTKESKGFTLRGEINYYKNNCKIIVYEESIDAIYQSGIGAMKQFSITKKQTLAMHLCHEFFHYLEFSSGKTVSEKLGKIRVPYFFNVTRLVDVIECSEIAAHSFAKQFCQLEVLPNYYDLYYLNQKRNNENKNEFLGGNN
ncbi:hypothetical protein BAU15_01830 [Enterococcus sp. JM4C]|uniref:hypothetical protein n=1 Tax=Candidatus Enterococcus huntleyi TaxID=1857217 RepID=UPI001379AA61|nr:hypothetical protein [Enterococcus sp. JM4C]KAF1299410.1 hypothetical protein BAU15_01830 [Enterococcus sp. JM4C]